MKKTIVLLCIATATLLFACKKSDSSSSTTSPSMTATINGTAFTANILSDNTAWSGSSDTTLFITGMDSVSGHEITLGVLKYQKLTGTFTIGGSNPTASAVYYKNGLSSFFSDGSTGQVVITQISPAIKGTFYFTTYDTTTIASGAFTATSL